MKRALGLVCHVRDFGCDNQQPSLLLPLPNYLPLPPPPPPTPLLRSSAFSLAVRTSAAAASTGSCPNTLRFKLMRCQSDLQWSERKQTLVEAAARFGGGGGGGALEVRAVLGSICKCPGASVAGKGGLEGGISSMSSRRTAAPCAGRLCWSLTGTEAEKLQLQLHLLLGCQAAAAVGGKVDDFKTSTRQTRL